MCNLLTVRKDLCQVLSAQDIPQGGLSQQPGGGVGIVDVGHGQDGVLHLVVDHAVHTDSHRVLGQNLNQKTTMGVIKDAFRGAFESVMGEAVLINLIHYTSCGGMSKVTVRMSTLMKLSVQGTTKNSPAEIIDTQAALTRD